MQLVFETTRLLVREFRLGDLSDVHEYAGDQVVSQYELWGPNKKSDTMRFIQDPISQIYHHPRLSYNFCIERKEDHKAIGGCGFFLEKSDVDEALIGYVLNPKYWRQGYASEAVDALLKYMKYEQELKHIFATCDSRNTPSQKLLEKVGFLRTKLVMSDFEQKGIMRDTLHFQLQKQQ